MHTEFDLGLSGLAAKLRQFPGECLNSNGTGMPALEFLPSHALVKVGETKQALIGVYSLMSQDNASDDCESQVVSAPRTSPYTLRLNAQN